MYLSSCTSAYVPVFTRINDSNHVTNGLEDFLRPLHGRHFFSVTKNNVDGFRKSAQGLLAVGTEYDSTMEIIVLF